MRKKIFSAEDLAQKLIEIRKNKKIVFTNGCFDVLHRGHTDYLQKSKELGDILIVALNSDDSIKRLKGEERPLNNLDDRLAVISALESVDFVTSFNDDTPIKLISLLKPDLLVKGGDWAVEDIVGAKEVISWGGKVSTIKYIDGKSTTTLIEKIRGDVKGHH